MIIKIASLILLLVISVRLTSVENRLAALQLEISHLKTDLALESANRNSLTLMLTEIAQNQTDYKNQAVALESRLDSEMASLQTQVTVLLENDVEIIVACPLMVALLTMLLQLLLV